jgi:hypothetical protein
VGNLVQSDILEEEEEVRVEDQNGAIDESGICDTVVADGRQE